MQQLPVRPGDLRHSTFEKGPVSSLPFQAIEYIEGLKKTMLNVKHVAQMRQKK